MERREMLKSVAAATLAAMSGSAVAGEHDHHSHKSAKKFAALIASSSDCVQTGEACLAHCLVLLGQGNKEMAGCAQSVNELMAVCTALEKLAGQGAKNTVKLAKLTADICTGCEKECRKHEKHAECKACADACAACAKECKALVG